MFRAQDYVDNSAYEHVRVALSPELRTLPNAQLEAVFAEADIDAAELDEFLGGFGKTLSSVGKSFAKALPGVAQVALPMVGTAFGGPLGGMIGGVAGQAIGTLAKGGGGRAVAKGALGQVAGMGAQLLGGRGGPAGAALQGLAGAGAQLLGGAGGGPAAAQLLQLLRDPRILQGLAATALGPAGARSIPIGGARIPPAAITNLVGQLAQQATLEAFAQEGGLTDLSDYAGESVDAANNTERARALLELLNETYPEFAAERDSEWAPERAPPAGRARFQENGDYDAYYEAYFDAFDTEGDDAEAEGARWA